MKALPLPEMIAGYAELAILTVFLIVILLAVLRNKKTGRSALYALAQKMQRGLSLLAAMPPTFARFVECLPDALCAAWQIERPRREEEDHPRRGEGAARSHFSKVVGM